MNHELTPHKYYLTKGSFLVFLLLFLTTIIPLKSIALTSFLSFPNQIDTQQERMNIQTVLNEVMTPSPNLVVDGVLGRKSIQAVQAFQEVNGLTTDGKIGPITRSVLEKAQISGNTQTTRIQTNINTSSPECSSGALFSIITGKLCSSTISTLPTGCTSSTLFSPLTGVSCNKIPTTPIPNIPITTAPVITPPVVRSGGGGGGSSPAPTCSGSTSQSCTITNGTGSQARTCNSGTWSDYGTCTPVSCNTGYQTSGNICVTTTVVAHTVATTFYISSSGNDSYDGLTTSTPWQSITKVNAQTFLPGDSILFKKGDTFYGSITISQSGTAGNPITFSSYGTGNQPIITGFTNVTAWTNLGGNIWESTSAVSTLPTVNMVTVNNVNTAMGRWPNSGWNTMTGVSGGTQITDSQLTGTPNWTGAEVAIRKKRWIIDRHPITNHSGSTLTFTSTSSYNPLVNWGYFIQNDLKTLDQQNEWYYNPASKKISIYSLSAPTNVKVVSIDTLATVYQHDYVTFDNISFEGSSTSTIFIKNAKHITIKNSDFDFAGKDTIFGPWWSNSTTLTILNNSIDNTNNNGIDLSGDFDNAIIRSNVITNTGLISGMGGSGDGNYHAVSTVGSNTTIELNRIINTGYIGINFQGNSINVNNNYIDNFCTTIDDCGGIYTWNGGTNPPVYTNRKVFNNIIVNGIGNPYGSDDLTSYAAQGIYMDDNTSNVEIYNNSTFNIPGRGIFLHDAHEINVHDNSTYNTQYQIGLQQDGNYHIQNNTINNNVFVSKTATQQSLTYSNDGIFPFETLGTLDNNYYVRPLGTDDHIISAEGVGYSLSSWQNKYGFDLHSHLSPVTISPYIINNIIGSNKFNNGSFTSNANGANCWNDVGNCLLSWNNNKLDGGTLQVSFDSKIPTANSLISVPVGAVSSGKNYSLKYSFLGSTNNYDSFSVYLRKSGTPYNYLTPANYTKISTTRSENEIVFTSPITDPNAVIVFEINTADSINNSVWFDNINLSEADVIIANPDDYFLFDYNATTGNKTVSLGSSSYMDVTGDTYSGSVTLSPYTSIILIKQGIVQGASTYDFALNLKYSSSGNEVKELQKILVSDGYLKGTPDGIYGILTLNAVKDYQKANSLIPDGVIGSLTREILNK